MIKEHLNHYYLRVSLIKLNLYVTTLTYSEEVIYEIISPYTIQNAVQA